MAVFRSGDQEVPVHFTKWAGRPAAFKSNYDRTNGSYNFVCYDKAPAYCYTSWQEWRETMTRWATFYYDSIRPRLVALKDDELLKWEDASVAKSMVNWRARGYGRLVFASDFESRSAEQADYIAQWMRVRGRRYVAEIMARSSAELSDIFWNATLHLDHGKGGPTWAPGRNTTAGLGLVAFALRSQVGMRRIEELHRMRNIPVLMSMYSRVQWSQKEVPLRSFSAGQIHAEGAFRGPKVRTIKAPPLVLNAMITGYWHLMLHIAKEIWRDVHAVEPKHATSVQRRYRYSIAGDFSTFDDTVGVETLQLHRDEVQKPTLVALAAKGVINHTDIEGYLEIDEWIAEAEILAPARHVNEHACILRTVGGVKSGERGTTVKALDIVWCVNQALRERVGRDFTDMSYGDDMLIMSDDPKALDRWAQHASEVPQFKIGVDDYALFLMRRAGRGYPGLARLCSRRINREPAEEARTAVEAALGIAAAAAALEPGAPLERHPLGGRTLLEWLHYCSPRLHAPIALCKEMNIEDIARVVGGMGVPSSGYLPSMMERTDRQKLLELFKKDDAVVRAGQRWIQIPREPTLRDVARATRRLSDASILEMAGL